MIRKKILSCLVQNITDLANSGLSVSFDSTNWEYGVLKIVVLIFSPFVIISNLMLIYGFHRTSRPLTTTTKLFILLSISDILNCLGFTLNAVMVLWLDNLYLCDGFYFFVFLNHFAFYFVFGIFAIISWLRFAALKNTFSRTRTRKIVILVFFCFLTSSLLGAGFVFLYMHGNLKLVFIAGTISSLLLVSFILFVFVINILSYLQLDRTLSQTQSTVSFVVRKWKSKVEINISEDRANRKESGERKREAIKTLIIITLFYMFCNSPLAIYPLVVRGISLSYNESNLVEFLLYYLSVLNGGVNSLIYILRNHNIRRVYSCKI